MKFYKKTEFEFIETIRKSLIALKNRRRLRRFAERFQNRFGYYVRFACRRH